MNKNQLRGLEEATRQRSEECIRLANEAIDMLKRQGKKITYVSVSKLSGVSRTTLYRTEVLKERIESLKAFGNEDANIVQRVSVKEGISREHQLREEINHLKKEKRMLIEQLIDRQEILDENEKLKVALRRLQLQRSEQKNL